MIRKKKKRNLHLASKTIISLQMSHKFVCDIVMGQLIMITINSFKFKLFNVAVCHPEISLSGGFKKKFCLHKFTMPQQLIVVALSLLRSVYSMLSF